MQTRAIVKGGFENARWQFGQEDERTGELLKVVGVWLSDRPLKEDEGPPGDAVLEVKMELSDEVLDRFEMDGVLWEARLWIVPAELLNPHATVRIQGVDPRSSWFHEALEDEGDDD